jgi:hypothetical protein
MQAIDFPVFYRKSAKVVLALLPQIIDGIGLVPSDMFTA